MNGVLFLVASALTLMGFVASMEDSFFQQYSLLIHSFSSPQFILGVVYEKTEKDGYPVDLLKIGLVFLAFTLTTYKVNESILEESPELCASQFQWKKKMLQVISFFSGESVL